MKKIFYNSDSSSIWWQVSTQSIWSEVGSADSTTTTVTRTRLTELGTPAPANLNLPDGTILTAQTESVDWRGNITCVSTYLHAATATKWSVTDTPASIQPAIQKEVAGYPVMDISYSSVTNSYTYDALARQTSITDGRGNTSITVYDSFGQIAYTEDAATNRTSFTYDVFGRRIAVTDPLTNTIHTAYDSIGNVLAQWGATYPVQYSYDTQGRMVSMSTTRDNTNWDTTSWLYDAPTGLLTNKLYANGLGISYSYHLNNKLATRTWARGVTTDYNYDAFGQLTSINYNDTTPDIAFEYDRLGYLETVTDASGTHTFENNVDGQAVYNIIAFAEQSYSLHELFDQYGLSSGYTLLNSTANASSQLCNMDITFNELGQIKEVDTSHLANQFRYSYLAGTDMVEVLEMPNGIIRKTGYAPTYDLPVSITHSNALSTILVERTFSYGNSKQLIDRTQYRQVDSVSRTDNFGYNDRKEVTTAVIGTDNYGFDFDSIGNRLSITENNLVSEYQANELNQYTNILYNSLPSSEFIPEFDLDGNQILIKTTTGIWHVTYNAENRPICFSNETAVMEMGYDYQGRRFEYREMVNKVSTRHERYLYRGYLQIAALDLLDNTNVIHTIVWDPTEPVATRPLLLQTPSDWFTYSFDQVKNVTELFDSNGAIAATYDYSPFGKIITASGSALSLNPLTFSSEVNDTTLGLIYYNYRHYNPFDGRWICRDMIEEEGGVGLYLMINNQSIQLIDMLGLDRYITWFDILGLGGSGSTQIHVGVAVDIWSCVNNRWKKNGQTTFDFSLDWEEGIWNFVKGTLWKGKGRITETTGLNLNRPITIKSTPCQDIKMLEILQKEVISPPFYSATFHHCLFWSVGALQYGMSEQCSECCE